MPVEAPCKHVWQFAANVWHWDEDGERQAMRKWLCVRCGATESLPAAQRPPDGAPLMESA